MPYPSEEEKEMKKKKAKRRGLKANPKRQAYDQLRGYAYQIWHSVNAWLDLADNEFLYLEGAEDFDVVSEDSATVVQVKDTKHKITLRSKEVNDAINHYWELQANHSNQSTKFRFLTRSGIGPEQGNPFGKGQMGLRIWSHCSGDETAITKISEFLKTEGKISETVADFLKKETPQEIYKRLIEPITWETENKEAGFVEKSIIDNLISHGDRRRISPSDSRKVVDRLLKEALMIATKKENRVLTRVRFLEIFEEETTSRVPNQVLQTLQMQATAFQNQMQIPMADSIRSSLIEGSSDITIQSLSPIQSKIPPLYPDVALRKDLIASVQSKLQSEGLAVIQGGSGMGKTTLAKLTANAINGSWFWLNFTKRDSSSIFHILQNFSIAFSNQASQVNIIFDDLNLQPHQLRQYEEVLGTVVYRILERGANLLITSQHKLPSNLIRQLGVSESVALQVPNFTISEIEQFAQQLGCLSNHVTTWAKLIRFHTKGHPRLVHARLARLREKGWKQDKNESILQTPQEVVGEREEARQLLIELPEDQREFLYRLSLMMTAFRKDYALSIGEISETIPHPGDTFSQLVGPWIDPVSEKYYAISPLLDDAANKVWSNSKVNDYHAQIANAILKTKNLTTTEAQAVFVHSMLGRNKEGFVAIVTALQSIPESGWKKCSPEFSWLLIHVENLPEELFAGDVLVKHLFRSLQYRVAVETKPEFAPKILEIWDKETKSYEQHKLYLLARMMLAMQALYSQVPLPVKKAVGYIEELINIRDNKEIQDIYANFTGQLEDTETDKANFFIFLLLFNLSRARRPFCFSSLSDLIDALDELQPKIRTLLLAGLKNDSIYARGLIDCVWLLEADLENPDWTRCLQVYDKVIERTIAWGYTDIALVAARGKAIIQDEYLHTPDVAHEILQDIVSKVGTSPVIEDERAMVYFHQNHYKEALDIYESILPEWQPSFKKLDLGPSMGYRQAAICAAHLDDWEKAAILFEEGAKRAQVIDDVKKQYIGLYADAGFAHFKADNMLDSLKRLILALREFEMLPEDNTDVNHFTLKKLLEYTIAWIKGDKKVSLSPESLEPSAGYCSNPERNEKVLTFPNFPIGYSWIHLAQIEYKFALGTTAFQYALQKTDRDVYPVFNFLLLDLELQYDFRNKTFEELPQRIYQGTGTYISKQKHDQSGKGFEEKGVYSISTVDLSRFASIERIIDMLVAALLSQLSIGRDTNEILAIWRKNSSGLPIRENIIIALDLVESVLLGDERNALTVMVTQDEKYEKRLVAALKIVHNVETNPYNLFYAHTIIAVYEKIWERYIETDLADLLAKQWLEKTKFQAILKNPTITVPEIERACNSNEKGRKKIGQILLAAYQAVSIRLPSDILQQFRSWVE